MLLVKIYEWFDAGFIQEWLAWAWVWSINPRWPKTDRRICDDTHVGDWIKPFSVVGLRCSIFHYHMPQDSILYYSQVQGKSLTIISSTLCKKNLTSAWEKTFFFRKMPSFPSMRHQPIHSLSFQEDLDSPFHN